MKQKDLLTITSLLGILLLSFHLTDDFLREGGMAVRGAWNLTAVFILFVLLCGTLLLAERRSGHLIMLFGGLAAFGMPVLHMSLARHIVTNQMARARGDYFFVWTLVALGVIGLLSMVLSVQGLWNLRQSQPR